MSTPCVSASCSDRPVELRLTDAYVEDDFLAEGLEEGRGKVNTAADGDLLDRGSCQQMFPYLSSSARGKEKQLLCFWEIISGEKPVVELVFRPVDYFC